jgi:hypothetical protein
MSVNFAGSRAPFPIAPGAGDGVPLAFRCVLLLLAAFGLAAPARADGTVYRARGCGDTIFVLSTNGFSVLQTDAGQGVKDGDELRGNVEQIGHPILFDQTLGRSVFALVAERHLTRSEVTERINARCRSAYGDVARSGYVSRAAGCGNKIFVNTPQGYAVMERISGGVVADGDTLVGNFDRPGRATMQDRQSGSSLVVFVEDVYLSKSAVERRMTASCQRNR